MTLEAPPNLLGDYHLSGCPASPACNLGAASKAVPSYQQPPATLAAPAVDFDDQARPALGGFDSGADEFGAADRRPRRLDLYFSTFGNTNPPGVAGTADDADIYSWNGTAFSRSIDVTAHHQSAAGRCQRRRLRRVDATHFYLSFSGDVTIPCLASTCRSQDEDVVYYNAGTWSLYFDGSASGLTAGSATDLDAISVVGGRLYFSTRQHAIPARCRRHRRRRRHLPLERRQLVHPGGRRLGRSDWSQRQRGRPRLGRRHALLPVLQHATRPCRASGTVQDEDVVYNNGGTWSVVLRRHRPGLTADNLDVDAFDVP